MAYKFKPIYKGVRSDSVQILNGLENFQSASFINDNKELVKSREYTRMVYQLQDIFQENYKIEKHIGFGRDYPGHPMIDGDFKLTGGELEAFETFRKHDPWKVPREKWIDFIQELFVNLSICHGHKPPAVFHDGAWGGGGQNTSFYIPHAVFLTGPRSLVVALHEYIHSLGYGEVGAVWWSSNAFKLTFPKSFAGLEPSINSPHLLVRKKTNKKDKDYTKKKKLDTKEGVIAHRIEYLNSQLKDLQAQLDKEKSKKKKDSSSLDKTIKRYQKDVENMREKKNKITEIKEV